MTADDSGQHDAVSLVERREQFALLSRMLEREAHILQREPEILPCHLHNMLYLDEGEESPAGPLLASAREALAGVLAARVMAENRDGAQSCQPCRLAEE